VKNLDASQYKWKPFSKEHGVFHHIIAREDSPKSVGEAFFNVSSFEKCTHEKNGERWTYYGSGVIHDYAAVQLEDGDILFCVVSGAQFAGTFSPEDRISMQYYLLTHITQS
jgi:hypothetical protein